MNEKVMRLWQVWETEYPEEGSTIVEASDEVEARNGYGLDADDKLELTVMPLTLAALVMLEAEACADLQSQLDIAKREGDASWTLENQAKMEAIHARNRAQTALLLVEEALKSSNEWPHPPNPEIGFEGSEGGPLYRAVTAALRGSREGRT